MNTIKVLRASLGLKQVEFADKLDITEQTVINWEKDKTVPNRAMYALIAQEFNVNFSWLKTGQGEMFNTGDKPVIEYNPSEYIYVPVLDDVKAAAGAGALVDNENSTHKVSFRKDWLNNHNITLNTLSAINVTGDSMFPTLLDGDILLVDHSQTSPIIDRIFVVRTDYGIVVKRSGGISGSKLLLKSDNRLISDLVIDMETDNACIIGRVVWFGRTI